MTQNSWQSSALSWFPGIPLSRILRVWFKLPSDSRALGPSVTKYQARVTGAAASTLGSGLGEWREFFLTDRQSILLSIFQGILQGLISQSPHHSGEIGQCYYYSRFTAETSSQMVTATEFPYRKTSGATMWLEGGWIVVGMCLKVVFVWGDLKHAQAFPLALPPWQYHCPQWWTWLCQGVLTHIPVVASGEGSGCLATLLCVRAPCSTIHDTTSFKDSREFRDEKDLVDYPVQPPVKGDAEQSQKIEKLIMMVAW